MVEEATEPRSASPYVLCRVRAVLWSALLASLLGSHPQFADGLAGVVRVRCPEPTRSCACSCGVLALPAVGRTTL